jgi:hypothetical protein
VTVDAVPKSIAGECELKVMLMFQSKAVCPGEKCLRHGTFMMFFFLDGEQLGLHLSSRGMK